ncbi:ParB/Srx family N-terminal domain-containing protein [Streptomyces sp. NPDC096040]|uniref:ParB/Srx family N-terminal domain-containing protein n=1 Tax=Streptomyces sp. NPDC096040 TaxID=3155541 RepID=UPI00332A313F
MSQATYVRTQEVALEELSLYPGNARRGDVRLILESLRTSGQYRSLIARQLPDGHLVVLAGNHTLQALALHGRGPCTASIPTFANPDASCALCNGLPWEPTARVEVVECDEETARRINLVDNRAAEKGDWDLDGLVELLSYLPDLDGTGYTDADVERLIAPPPSLEELADTYAPREDYGDETPAGRSRATPAAEPADRGEGSGLWPVLRLRIPPAVRDEFYAATATCPRSADDGARLAWLLELTRPTREDSAR